MNGNGTLVTHQTSAQKPAFLAFDPPHWGARGLAYILILLFVAGIVASIVIRTPETVACFFVLVPTGGSDPVRAPCEGFIDRVCAAETQSVSRGDALFMIRSDVSGDRSGEQAGLDVQVRGAKQAIATAQERYASLSRMDQEEMRNLQARDLALARKIERTLELHGSQEKSERSAIALADKEIESLTQELEFRRKVYAVAAHAAQQVTKLVQTHAVSDLENLRIQLEADRARLELHNAERELSAANLKRSQLQTDQETHHTERSMAMDQLQNERREVGSALATLRSRREAAQQQQAELLRGLEETIAKCTIRIASLKGQLDRTTGNQVAVSAPCAGSVLRLRVKSAGAFVRTGDVLCELAGSGDRLEAELTVPPVGAGRIAVQQTVKLYYDAFPYQRHGVKYGTIRWVSPAGTGDNDHHDFRALAGCRDEKYIVDGQERKLRAGMCGRAEILVGRHALISYAFEPLRQLKESMDGPP